MVPHDDGVAVRPRARRLRHSRPLLQRQLRRLQRQGPRAAALLFALAACRGHMGALRDLAFCVTNGFSMRQDAAAGHRFTFTANLKEFRATYLMEPEMAVAYAHVLNNPGCLTSELGCFTTVPASLQGWAHPANRFLCEWFAAHPQLLPPARLPPMCSFPTCGRPETRRLHRSSTAAGTSAASRATAPAPASRCTRGWDTGGSASLCTRPTLHRYGIRIRRYRYGDTLIRHF